jgi:quercetin dioxygenase-like cupin family protein
MKTSTYTALLVLALAFAAPVVAQTALTPRVLDHKTITIADAYPAIVAGQQHALHARKIELAPGARTEMIDRTGRPAITYVTRGEVLEHRDGSAEPIRHTLRAATMDKGGVRHYWENASNAPAELLVVELTQDAAR